MVSHARTSLITVGVLLMSLLPAGAVSAGQTTPVTGQLAHLNAAPARPAYLDSAQPVARRVKDLLSRMTLEEKVGQMTQAERGAVAGDPSQIATLRLGSVLSGGGSTPTPNTPAAWVDMVNEFQSQALNTRLGIPIIYGIDAVHGHGNVYGATVFPHNIGLGSTRDPALVKKIGEATAEEVRATGIPWSFGPCVCVARDERWGRTYESFGEDPRLVSEMETIIDGLQGNGRAPVSADHVLATAKHYAGDGDTEYDYAAAAANVGQPWYLQRYTIDQGITVTSRDEFSNIDLAPYATAIRRHGVRSVMPSFSSVDWIEDGVGDPIKMHAHQELITDVLKGRYHFPGFVISDWEGIHQIPDPANPGVGGLTPYKVRVGVNAGTDMFMEPFSAQQFEELLLVRSTPDGSAGHGSTTPSAASSRPSSSSAFRAPVGLGGQHRPGGQRAQLRARRARRIGAAEEQRGCPARRMRYCSLSPPAGSVQVLLGRRPSCAPAPRRPS